jgi:hypothetical protein
MRVLLRRGGSVWYDDAGSPIRLGRRNDCQGGWGYVVFRDNDKRGVRVYRNGENQYVCNITQSRSVLLLAGGAAELAYVDREHLATAVHVVGALAERQKPIHFASVRVLRPGGRVDNVTFRSRSGTHNAFTDGAVHAPGSADLRQTMHTTSATYLVRTLRHNNIAVYAVEVTVQEGYDRDGLVQCLRTLA